MKKILPKGLHSLVPVKSKAKPKKKKASVYYVEISKIKFGPEHKNREINKKELRELIQSVRQFGVVQPILVLKKERRRRGSIKVDYQLVSGHKRLLAAKLAGLAVVPTIIKEAKKEAKAKKR